MENSINIQQTSTFLFFLKKTKPKKQKIHITLPTLKPPKT